VHRLRNKEEEVPEEVEAEKDGIVYVKYVSACKIAVYIVINVLRRHTGYKEREVSGH
jgi:succinyl-CoA synthetase alpha subunit